MVLRIWHGYTTPENAAAYERVLTEEVVKEIEGKKIPGFGGIQMAKRSVGAEVEFVTVMSFADYESVKLFAGDNYEWAYVPPAARNVLSRFDAKAQHFEVISSLPSGM